MVILGLIIIALIVMNKEEFDFLWGVGMFVIIACIVLLFLPIEGWQDRQCISEQELVALKLDEQAESDKVYYVKENQTRTYDYAIDASGNYELNGIAYEAKNVNEPMIGGLEIYESKDCMVPILKTYKTKPNRGTFTFAPFSTKTHYVFYIPEGTIQRYVLEDNSSESSSSSE